MPSERQKNAGYVLPAAITGHNLMCVQLMIPDVKEYRAAFLGALYELTKWWNWEKSWQLGDRRASEAASYWLELLTVHLAIDGCEVTPNMFDVRQNPTFPCKLEKTEDGLTWVEFADLQKCPPKIKALAGRLLYSSDGGATWQPVQEDDYTTYDWKQDEPLRPARTGDNKKCLAAANAVAVFVELHDEIVAWYEGAGTAIKLAIAIQGVIALLFPVGALYIAAAMGGEALALNILQYTGVLNRPAFTQSIQDQLQCIFYTWADEDGRWSETAFDGVIADVQGKGGDMWRLLEVYLGEIGGYTGLNNAGTTTSVASAECNDCESQEWCHEWDFTVSQQGWTGEYSSVWDAGGWSDNNPGQYDGLYIYLTDLPSMALTRMELDFTPDGWNGNSAQVFIATAYPVSSYDVISGGTADFTKVIDFTQTQDGELTVTGVLYVAADRWVGGIQRFGDKRLSALRIYGNGTNPFGENNCT